MREHACEPAVRGRARGALLLETMLALVVFVVAALAILALVDRSMRGLSAARDAEHAALLARSAMASIEAGVASPQSLNGPVRAGDAEEGSGAVDMNPARTGWELEITTEPAPVSGLTLVRVTALKRAGGRTDAVRASHTIRQFVRLSRTSVSAAGGGA